MKKMGWKEGDGLGKNLDGIVEPIKAKKKLNSNGLGFTKNSHSFSNDFYEAKLDAMLKEKKKRKKRDIKKLKYANETKEQRAARKA